MRAWDVARNLLARAARITDLEAYNTLLSHWLEDAEKGHRAAMMEADRRTMDNAALQEQVDMLRARGCCMVDGGEDGGEGR